MTAEGEVPEFKWGDSQDCEAVIIHNQIQKGQDRYVVPFDGHERIDLGHSVEERPEVFDTQITCDSKFCHFSNGFKSEGMGFSAGNQANEKSVEYIRENCGKWKALVKMRLEQGKMPRKMVPQGKTKYLPFGS